jgi:hypothetical protein
MIKFRQFEQKITPFGGFNFCLDRFKTSGLAGLIDRHLGSRGEQAAFSYSEIWANHLGIFLCGGDATEDVTPPLQTDFEQMRGITPCSADTILGALKQLANPSCIEKTDRGVPHTFNRNRSLNGLMVKALRTTGQLNSEEDYTLDYDNTIVETEKCDARKTYRQDRTLERVFEGLA